MLLYERIKKFIYKRGRTQAGLLPILIAKNTDFTGGNKKMIERYTHPEMGHIWTLENEFRTMLQVEILACEAMNKLGIVPDDALKDIQTKADFRIERIKEIEAVTNHDIIAFLTNVAEYVGDASKYIHKGLTSSDVKDTALGVMMKQSADLLLSHLEKFHAVLKRRAAEHKHTIMIGRTHGIHAEPMTF